MFPYTGLSSFLAISQTEKQKREWVNLLHENNKLNFTIILHCTDILITMKKLYTRSWMTEILYSYVEKIWILVISYLNWDDLKNSFTLRESLIFLIYRVDLYFEPSRKINRSEIQTKHLQLTLSFFLRCCRKFRLKLEFFIPCRGKLKKHGVTLYVSATSIVVSLLDLCLRLGID